MTTPLRQFTALAFCLLSLGSASALRGEEKPDMELIPPVAIYKVDPTHPSDLYARGIEGEAYIIASVDMFGSVVEPMVDHASEEEFGLAALIAASEWIFEPATRNGVPLAVRVKIPFNFAIAFEHKLNIEVGRKVFQKVDVPVIASFELNQAPLPTFVPAFDKYYPEEFANTGKSAAVTVEFVINPDGQVINPRIISASSPGFGEAAMRAVSQIQYRTIRVEGQPVYVSITMPIQFAP